MSEQQKREAGGWVRGVASLRGYVATQGHAFVPTRYVTGDGYRLGAWVARQRRARKLGVLSPEKIAELDSLGFVWSEDADRGRTVWRDGVLGMWAFLGEHGHARVPDSYINPEGFRLGAWVARQRRARKLGTLAPEKIAELDSLGFVWIARTEGRQNSWRRGVDALLSYKAEHRHVLVPQIYETPDGFPLGRWLSDARESHRRDRLSADQVKELDELGVVWDPGSEMSWLKGVADLRIFVQDWGHADVAPDYVTAEGVRLGQWVSARRRERRKGVLPSSRVTTLNELGFVWEVPPPAERRWAASIAALRVFIAEHGHSRVPHDYITDTGLRLGTWVSRCRTARRRHALTDAQVAELDTLGFDWGRTVEDQWARGIAALRDFVAEHGHARVPQGYIAPDGFRLGDWVRRKRHVKRHSERYDRPLSVQQVVELDALGFDWGRGRREQGERGAEALRKFIAEHGHARVPQRYIAPDGYRLGAWVDGHRSRRRQGDLAPERIADLDALGFDWGFKVEDQWTWGVEALRAYVVEHGHAQVPSRYVDPGGFKLGMWVVKRRAARRRSGRTGHGRLTDERIAELDALGFDWGD